MKKTKTGHLLKAGIAALAALLLLGGCSGGAGGSDTDGSTDMPPDRPRNNGTATESVYDLGAVGDGKTDDSAAFAASGDGWLRVPAGRYRIAKKTAVTRKLSFEPGAVIEAEAGVAITFREVIEAGESYQIIRNGRVVMEKNNICYPEWFGAVADGKTDCTAAIQQAINSLAGGYGKIVFAGKKYLVSDTIRIKNGQDHLTLEGIVRHTRENAPTIVSAKATGAVLEIKGSSGEGDYSGSLEDITVRNMEFSRQTMGGENTDTIYIDGTLYTTLENVGFSMSQNGVRVVGGNGIRFNTCHGTTGGDIPGKEVRGIYIDGTKRGSTGILITDYIYYGYGSPNSISYGYKDYNARGAVGGTTGDRRITNFECSGDVDYGIAIMSDSCGWSCDVTISAVTMDGVRKSGIYMYAAGSRTFQQANIVNTYFRLAHAGAEAVTVDTYSNVNIVNLMVDNAVEGAKNTAVSYKKASGGTVTSTAFAGNDYDCVIKLEKCSNIAVTANTSVYGGRISLTGSKNCVITGNAMNLVRFEGSDNTNCIAETNIFAAE